MGALVWLSLLFLVAVFVIGVVYAIRCGLKAWRALSSFFDRVGGALEDALKRLDETPHHIDAAAVSTERLADALARLSRSRARLALLTGAFAEVRAGVNGAFAYFK